MAASRSVNASDYHDLVIAREAILAVLHTIPDPEMPISIVDLGLVEGVAISPSLEGGGQGVGGPRRSTSPPIAHLPPTPAGSSVRSTHPPAPSLPPDGRGSGTTAQPSATVHITLLPTFIGCPALDMIAGDVRAKVGTLPGVASVEVSWVHDPPWTVDRITPAGRAALHQHGVTVPLQGSHLSVAGHEAPQLVTLQTTAIPCPFCGSTSTRLDSPFGPTRCRTIYYCDGCRNSFEHMKRV